MLLNIECSFCIIMYKLSELDLCYELFMWIHSMINIHVPYCSGAKIFHAETSLRETPMETKFLCAGRSAGLKHAHTEMFRWWNVHAKMSLAKMSRVEMLGSLCNGNFNTGFLFELRFDERSYVHSILPTAVGFEIFMRAPSGVLKALCYPQC